MRKAIAFILGLALLLVACNNPATESSAPPASSEASSSGTAESTPAATDKEVVIFTWADYLSDEFLAQFEADTGIKPIYTYFESNEEMLIKLGASQGDYDLILASDYIIASVVNQNLAQELDKEQIPRFSDIDPVYQSHFYDPENKYTVPFAAGTPLIVYDPDKVDIEIKGYADLWNPALENSVVMFDDARLVVGFTMKMLGGSLNSTDPDLIAEAEQKLRELKPNIRVLDYASPHTKMISGEASVGFMFTPQVIWTLREKPNLKVVYPEEGMGFGIDSFFIPAGAPHSEEAHIFLNYILDGKVSAELSEFCDYINCVTTAKQYLSEETLSNEFLYIPAEILGDAEFIEEIDTEAAGLIQDAWTRFKQQ